MDADNRFERVRAAIEQLGPAEHVCTLYDQRDKEVAIAASYVRAGLERSELCVCVVDDGGKNILDALASEGIDTGAEMRKGRLVIFEKPLAQGLQTQDMLGKIESYARGARPSTLDEFGLVGALRLLVARHGERTGVRASFVATPTDARAPVEIETACFRIAQEALSNVARHARARHVEVTLTVQDAALEVTVRDDGVGFNVERRHTGLGLVGVGERAELAGGRLDIESAPGAGATLRARFPLPSPKSVAGTDP